MPKLDLPQRQLDSRQSERCIDIVDCPALHELYSISTLAVQAAEVSDASLSLIAQHCTNLQYLNVSETYGRVTDTSISLIAQHCTNLQHLNVSCTADKVTDKSSSTDWEVLPQSPASRRQLDRWQCERRIDIADCAVLSELAASQRQPDKRPCERRIDIPISAVLPELAAPRRQLDRRKSDRRIDSSDFSALSEP